MDADRFDDLTRALTGAATSRRAVLKGVAGGTLGAVAVALGFKDTGAIHWGCRHARERCSRGSQCCSSRCQGQVGNKTCRAHHEGSCTAAKDFCLTVPPGTTGCGGGSCLCYRTTGSANFCSSGGGPCIACITDRECERATGVPGSACVDFNHVNCTGCLGSATVCALPCTA